MQAFYFHSLNSKPSICCLYHAVPLNRKFDRKLIHHIWTPRMDYFMQIAPKMEYSHARSPGYTVLVHNWDVCWKHCYYENLLILGTAAFFYTFPKQLAFLVLLKGTQTVPGPLFQIISTVVSSTGQGTSWAKIILDPYSFLVSSLLGKNV